MGPAEPVRGSSGAPATGSPGSPGSPGGGIGGRIGSVPALPSISLPKGGGAIRGMGEKFSATPVTGTGSMSVPIATSPGRSGFGPQLALTYDSGAGNGPFGFGWSLTLPAITRKTDKGLPRYLDAEDSGEDSDTFILAGAEDLVPVYQQAVDGSWVTDADGNLVIHEDTLDGHRVRRYRPRIEGLFARIERWTRIGHPEDVHWRSISRDNILTVYGGDAGSRIADPDDERRIFSWLICETRDDRGNGILYRYAAEDGTGAARGAAHQRNRGRADDPRRAANRYLKRIAYGNRVPLLDAAGQRPRFLDQAAMDQQLLDGKWMFEVVFDYGEHDEDAPLPVEPGPWAHRHDAFSSYRACFEVRTARRCRRVLMFHHFPADAEVGRDCLVRSTVFRYADEVDPLDPAAPSYSFLRSVTAMGHRRVGAGYLSRSLPPVEFDYSRPVVQARVEEVDPAALEHLPAGLDGTLYQWVDLHGEGIPGILTEQAGAWYYQRNLSPLPVDGPGGGTALAVRLGPLETVALRPSPTLTGGAALMDLAGDGQPDLVVMDGQLAGLFEHDEAEGWAPFRPFPSRLNRDLRDPNLRLVDVDGDGLADVLVTEDGGVTWHRSLGEDGFEAGVHVPGAHDEELGPRLVFADAERSVHVADLSGDGLGDLVQVRQGEVAYYPSLGFGRYGRRVTMDDSPTFDLPGRFDPRRLLLADIDGSGTTDLIYLHPDGVRLYFNQSGNGWSDAVELPVSPPIDEAVSVVAIDLLGNGTACLVWSSPLERDARRQMRYVDLMGTKPHLLVRTANNLGAETRISYAPSTRFYLEDRAAGRPWIRRLPFPVHVVERVETVDYIGRNRFVTRYAYHHGHYDGEEREFRGFGLVDQWDTERMAALTATGDPLTDDNIDAASHVPPVRTRTWFHTGAFTGRDRVARQYEDEYWREPGLAPDQARELLLDDTVLPDELTLDELPEAARALKGAMLRQEVYAEDAGPGATADQRRRAETPYTVTEQSHALRLVQPRGRNRHAVFLAHASETLSYHYERDPFDPRVQHALVLEVDALGNVLKEATAAYGRRATIRVEDGQVGFLTTANPGLTALLPVDAARQTTALVIYAESALTIDVADDVTHRLRSPCERVTFELTHYPMTGPDRYLAADLVEVDPGHAARMRLRPGDEVEYEEPPTGNPCRRRIEHVRLLYRADDMSGLLPIGQQGGLGLPGEQYRLAFTPGLLATVFQRVEPGQAPEALIPDPVAVLGDEGASGGGYVSSESLMADGRVPAGDPPGSWWLPSGRGFYHDDASAGPAAELAEARDHFFLPRRRRDPFGADTTIEYDTDDLLAVETRDPLDNRVTALRNDYRLLMPRLVADANRNRTEVAFNVEGLVVAVARMGKSAPAPAQGDSLAGLTVDLDQATIAGLFDAADPIPLATQLVGGAGNRVVYDLGRFQRSRSTWPDAPDRWQPPAAATIARETHQADPQVPGPTPIQLLVTYSDGLGREIQRKSRAEPGPIVAGGPIVARRWVGSGWTIHDNKGATVRRFEPFFTATQGFEFGFAAGVSAVAFYDPVGRAVATLFPERTYEKSVFDAWQETRSDRADTSAPRGTQTGDPATDPDIGGYVRPFLQGLAAGGETWEPWAVPRLSGSLGPRERDAAIRSAAHAETPVTVHGDVLGRGFLTIVRNRVTCPGHQLDGTEARIASRVGLDIEGNEREVRDGDTQQGDPLGRIVTHLDFDVLGNVIRDQSMEAGSRWTLVDVTGNVIRGWDDRGHAAIASYDALRRPTRQVVRGSSAASDPATLGRDVVVDEFEYGEPALGASPADQARAIALNLRTRVYRHFDTAGIAINARLDAAGVPTEAYDFKGNLLRSSRRLVADYRTVPHWGDDPVVLDETFEAHTTYDALDRPIQSVAPHSMRAGATRNVIQRRFNEAGLLEGIDVWLERASDPAGLIDPVVDQPATAGIAAMDYEARGRRIRVLHSNGVQTRFDYDPLTFRIRSVYTRRGATFAEDADNPQPPPARIPAPEDPPADATAGLQNLRYTYDAAGNITHIRDRAQQTVFFRNQRVEPSNDYVYDAAYRLIRATGREHLGQQGGARLPPRAADAFDGFRTRLDHPGDGTALGTYEEDFVLDATGNLLEVRHRGSDPAHAGWTRSYAYSESSLLEVPPAGHPGKTSNRLSSTTIDPTGPNPIGEPLRHDAHGNVIRLAHLGGGAPGPNLHWDLRDRLRRVDLGGGGVAFYQYDSSGERVRKVWEKAPGLTEERVYLGDSELFRRHSGAIAADSVTLERETLHVADGADRVTLIEIRTLDTAGVDQAPRRLTRSQHPNHLGTAVLELDDRAQILSYEEFTPHGSSTYQAVRSQTETPKRYRFSGKERDEESGLYYFGARYYVPWLGRWASCDPEPVRAGATNRFEYVRSNPVWLRDPDGRQEQEDILAEVVTGDFHEGKTTWSGTFINIGVGLIPIVGQVADARDTAAAVTHLYDEPSWGNAGVLGLAIVGWVPGIGDAIKGGGKIGRKALKGAAKEAIEKTGKEALEKTTKETLEKTTKETVEKTTKEAVEHAPGDVAKKAEKQTAKHAADDAASKADDKAFDEFHGGKNEEAYDTTDRLRRGNLGEKLATDALAADGHKIIQFKPSILGTNQGGIDMVTIKDGVVHFVDNKALTRGGNVSSVSALTKNFAKNKDAVVKQLEDVIAGASGEQRKGLQEALDAVKAGKFKLTVTNANLTKNDAILSGVTDNLKSQGIEFIDVFKPLKK
jgi:RHS repeat-associated protein